MLRTVLLAVVAVIGCSAAVPLLEGLWHVEVVDHCSRETLFNDTLNISGTPPQWTGAHVDETTGATAFSITAGLEDDSFVLQLGGSALPAVDTKLPGSETDLGLGAVALSGDDASIVFSNFTTTISVAGSVRPKPAVCPKARTIIVLSRADVQPPWYRRPAGLIAMFVFFFWVKVVMSWRSEAGRMKQRTAATDAIGTTKTK